MNAPVTLYTITQEFIALEDLLEEQAGATEADADVVAGWLAELEGSLASKVERCVRYIRTQEALSQAMTEEAARLRARADVHDNRVKRLKDAMRLAMATAALTKIETPAGAVAVQRNGGKQPVSLLVPLEAVPDDVCRLEKKIDDEKIRAALEAAGGSTDYAVLQERGTHLRIR